jgi:beta-N-acetylhexosaminidase
VKPTDAQPAISIRGLTKRYGNLTALNNLNQGVVMTDSLYMKGISLQYNLGQAAVLAVMAGDDLLEGAFDSYSMRFMMDSIKGAMADGRISQARIDQSVRRILALKLRFGLLPLPDHSSSRA